MTEELRILIVDDDEVDRMAVRRALSRTDLRLQVEEATDGLEGIECLRTTEFDCVFLDYQLPPSDGLEVLKKARASGIDTPVVMLTGEGDEQVAAEVMRAGATDYLTKETLTPETLARSVQYVTRVHRSEQALRWLASFPEQAPEPIIEVSASGEITYLNPPAERLFPGIRERGLSHPVFNSWDSFSEAILAGETPVTTREVQVDDEYFHVTISRVEGHARIRLYAACITERKRAEQQLAYGAFYDMLTGLLNRDLFSDRLGQALERARRHEEYAFGVLFLDLDRFKLVNDSLGHQRGDQLLCAAAERLRETVRAEDTVARFGGDEFAVLVENPEDIAEVTLIAGRIKEAFGPPFEIGDREVYSSVSIGIALSSSDYLSTDALLRGADTAMYRAKAGGGDSFQVFDKHMHAQAMAILQMETELRRALEQQQFCLEYQPIIDLRSGRLTGFEALLRWQHPSKGLVLPGEFLSVASDTGIIINIDSWVLGTACRQLSAWKEHLAGERPVAISVNLSSHQFVRRDLLDEIRLLLADAGPSCGSCLILEITETAIMENLGAAADLLSDLRPLGIRVSVDDFGTGYSSLSYLRRLPIDTLKIDRSFVHQVLSTREDLEIVRAIIALAKNLGLRVVAEGVETLEQCERFVALECDMAQGFWFSRPVDADQATRLIEADRQWLAPLGRD